MTYSIVARDPESGALGVAVQSATLAVGSTVAWARPGVGVVATQAMTEPAYGPRCLDGLAAGRSPADALALAIADDPAPTLRQVSVLCADGRAAATTGELCIEHAGHLIGDGFAVQANMMVNVSVWSAMADAFTSSTSPFPRRLLDALLAAQAAGGDGRGVMSTAIVVVAAEPCDPWAGRLVDLRVDRSHDPLGDLEGLLVAADAYEHFNRGVEALFRGEATAALEAIDAGLVALPGEENLLFLRIGSLLATGSVDEAEEEFRALVARHAGWEVIARSFAAKGLLALPPGAGT